MWNASLNLPSVSSHAHLQEAAPLAFSDSMDVGAQNTTDNTTYDCIPYMTKYLTDNPTHSHILCNFGQILDNAREGCEHYAHKSIFPTGFWLTKCPLDAIIHAEIAREIEREVEKAV